MHRFAILLITLSLSSAAPTQARADSHAHEGFFARAATGVGYHRSAFDLEGEDLVLQGLAFPTSIAVGYSVLPRWVLQVELFDSTGFKLKASPERLELGDERNDAGSTGVGIGVTHYFGTGNYYWTASLGLALGNYIKGDDTTFTKLGVGAAAGAGKEWWVSDQWGLGASLQLLVNRTTDDVQNGSLEMLSVGLGVLASATYN